MKEEMKPVSEFNGEEKAAVHGIKHVIDRPNQGDRFSTGQPEDRNHLLRWMRGDIILNCPIYDGACTTETCPLWSNEKKTCKVVHIIEGIFKNV